MVDEGYERWSTRPALVAGDVHLSYAELRAAAQRFAGHLASHGVNAGDRVALLAPKSAESVVVILGCALADITFVPLDPRTPSARLAALLQDVAPSAVVALPEHDLPHGRFARLDLSRALDPRLAAPAERTAGASRGPAYILYTSGSSGRPKGVMIGASQIRTFFEDHNQRVGIAPGDRCMNTGPFHFDVSIMDVFLPLYFGATVYLTPAVAYPPLLLETLANERIQHFYAVASLLALITGDGSALDHYDLSSLKCLQSGAEPCDVAVVNQWLRRWPELGFLNSYGPTEVTVGCISYRKPGVGPLSGASCPIGAPHARSEVKLVDAAGAEIVEPGRTGELLLGGAQLMDGYWQRPEEEARVFVELAGRRYYRSGDLARLDGHGQYHYVGRVDDELKINGQRIHLDEVRACIRSAPGVLLSSVGVFTDTRGARHIGAAVVLRTHEQQAALHVLEHAAQRLPAGVAPTTLLACDELPRSSSGKLSHSAAMELVQTMFRRAPRRVYLCSFADVRPTTPG